MSGAVSGYLGIKSNGHHQFVNDTFRHFCARKTQIILNLEYMDYYIKNEEFVSLIMNPVKEQKYSDISDDDVNIFKPVLFELFGKVREVVIYTSAAFGKVYVYSFNLDRFLKHVLCSPSLPTSLKRIEVDDEGKEWLEAAFSDSMKQS